MDVTPLQFISKWQDSPLKERSAAQEHFLDICRLLDEPTPASADASGINYGFEVGAAKTTGGRGFADVFKRNFFAWEYKGAKANLDAAFSQLQRYAVALDNPPLLIVSDIGTRILIHTNWTNSVSKTYTIAISDLDDPEKRAWLKAAFSDPDVLKPIKTRRQLTEEVAGSFAELAFSLRKRGFPAERVAHFVNRLVFCMFAEDVKLLPDNMFTRMLERSLEDPAEFETFARNLFTAMQAGGRVGFERIAWFNGGLFDDDLVFPLTIAEIRTVHNAAKQYWGDIDPSILGTLFERGLDPDKRSQLGAHYTDRDMIMLIIDAVITGPLTEEWQVAKNEIADAMEKGARSKGARATKARNQAESALARYLKRLADFRILDPACGSGNFLYLALKTMKDLEHRAQIEAEALGLPRSFPRIGPEVVLGLEMNPYAAELARVSVWIGEIQWMLKNGFAASKDPILKSLSTVECRDAILDHRPGLNANEEEWSETIWPAANVIIGNPPFLGSKFFRKGRRAAKDKPAMAGLGDVYTDGLFRVFSKRVAGSADLVTYWFHKSGMLAQSNQIEAFGLIATKSIAKGASNDELQRLVKKSDFRIFSAWQNIPWVVDGADVRVSIVCARPNPKYFSLQGKPVAAINPDLTSGIDVSRAISLKTNHKLAFQGVKLNGPFSIARDIARAMLVEPLNVNGLPNSCVVRRFIENDDVTVRDQDSWVIDFTNYPRREDAARFQSPFTWLEERVQAFRESIGSSSASEVNRLEKFWLMQRPRPELRKNSSGLQRIIVVPETSEHLIFQFVPANVVVSGSLFAICSEESAVFGVLSSRFHRLWATAKGNQMGVGNQARYNATRTFQTFPFPKGLSPRHVDLDSSHVREIRAAADLYYKHRDAWQNPPELIARRDEVVPNLPPRYVGTNSNAANALKERSLTSLYNQNPAWLRHDQKVLDDAVAAAYGWPVDIGDEEVMLRLLNLNERGGTSRFI